MNHLRTEAAIRWTAAEAILRIEPLILDAPSSRSSCAGPARAMFPAQLIELTVQSVIEQGWVHRRQFLDISPSGQLRPLRVRGRGRVGLWRFPTTEAYWLTRRGAGLRSVSHRPAVTDGLSAT